MKKFTAVFLFVWLACIGYAQQIPSDIRAIMDNNKIKGIDVWSGIKVRYSVLPQGLDSTGKITLTDRAHQLPEIKSIQISTTGTVYVTCVGGTHFDYVKKIFSNIVTGLGPVTATYVVEQTENTGSE